jgi:hypothetical protein
MMTMDYINRYKFVEKVLILFILTFITSCEYEKTEPLDLGDLPEVVSFSEHIQPVFNDNCIKCHGGSTSPDLSEENAYFDLTSGNYIDTDVPENSYIYQKISGSGSMAPYAEDYDRALILKWIEQGAEDN